MFDVAGCQTTSYYVLFEIGVVETQARAYAVRVVWFIVSKAQRCLGCRIGPEDLIETISEGLHFGDAPSFGLMYLLDLLGYWIVMRHLVLVSLRAFSLAEEDLLYV